MSRTFKPISNVLTAAKKMQESDEGLVSPVDKTYDDATPKKSIGLYTLGELLNVDAKSKPIPVDGLKVFRSFKITHHSMFRSNVVGVLLPIIRDLHVLFCQIDIMFYAMI